MAGHKIETQTTSSYWNLIFIEVYIILGLCFMMIIIITLALRLNNLACFLYRWQTDRTFGYYSAQFIEQISVNI